MVIAKRVAASPAESFPELMASDAELEATYRFFQNDSVTPQELMRPHVEATIARVKRERLVRIAHDTVTLSFKGDRGLGSSYGTSAARETQAFSAHTALAISGGEGRAVLGVIGIDLLTHSTVEQRQEEHRQRLSQYQATGRYPAPAVRRPASEKWSVLPRQIHPLLDGVHAVHVMDEEADDSRLLEFLSKGDMPFVIRGDDHRRIETETGIACVADHLSQVEIVLCRRVRLEARLKPVANRTARKERDAKLTIRAARVTLAPAHANKIEVNVVEVTEFEPPPNEEPVHWVLFTNESIADPEQVAEVVDHYRARWRIEEYFKALKTGCSIERRQLTSYGGLTRVLALMVPIAWKLMMLRTAARESPTAPATKVLSRSQITVLRALAKERNHIVPNDATAEQVMLAVANLGGHLKRNGPPGWITLARGYRKLLAAQHVWTLALQAATCDQS